MAVAVKIRGRRTCDSFEFQQFSREKKEIQANFDPAELLQMAATELLQDGHYYYHQHLNIYYH